MLELVSAKNAAECPILVLAQPSLPHHVLGLADPVRELDLDDTQFVRA